MIPGSATPLFLPNQGDSAYKIDRSLRFNSADSAYLNRTPPSAGNRRTFTWSGWAKRSNLTGNYQGLFIAGPTSGAIDGLFWGNNEEIYISLSAATYELRTNAVFRDTGAWYHIVLAVDTTQATAADRVKLFVNGVQQTFTNTDFPWQNVETNYINNTNLQGIGSNSSAYYLDGYLADVHFIDGQALAATDFGKYDDNNVWQPKEYAGGFDDWFNNSQTWSGQVTGTEYSSTYAKTKAFDGSFAAPALPADDNELVFTPSPTFSNASTVKIWYYYPGTDTDAFKINGTSVGDTLTSTTGILTHTFNVSGFTSLSWSRGKYGTEDAGIYMIEVDGVKLLDASVSAANNSFHLNFADNSSNAALGYDAAGSNDWTVNNLVADAPGLETANQGFDVVTYTGNGSTQSISSLAFQPDFVWFKALSNTYSHSLFDSVRGVQKRIKSNSSDAEATDSTALTAFNSDGFTVSGSTSTNSSNKSYVAWCWKAGGTAVSNTDGSITASVSANQTYGFSIVSYTGTNSAATVGHGLNSVVKMIIVKNRDTTNDWNVYHVGTDGSNPGQYHLRLNTSDARNTGSGKWNNTSPTSSVFSIADSGTTNGNGNNLIAYCWSEVSGFSKFGSYTGTGASNTITTGFKPRWILFKRSSGADNWFIYDTARDTTNPNNAVLRPNLSDAELASSVSINFNADGFSMNTSDSALNQSGETYIYAAFADKPPGEIIDSLIDTPTDYQASPNNGGNYATINPLDNPGESPYGNQGASITNGNLDFAATGSFYALRRATTQVPSSGKWYMECTINGSTPTPPTSSSQASGFGLCKTNIFTDGNAPITDANTMWLGCSGYGLNFSTTRTDWASGAVDQGDVISLALDMDANTFEFKVNNSSVQSGTIGTTDPVHPFVFSSSTSYTNLTVNFGQRSFAYTPPTGYLSLCTTNLPDPTIADGSTVFDVVARSGGGTTQILSFSPDLFWMKRRDAVSGHYLFDSIRTGDNYLRTDSSAAEVNSPNSFTFNSNGYTVPSNFDWGSSATVVDWAWDGGTSNTSISVGGLRAASTVSSGNAYSVGWAGVGGNTWADTDSWSGLSAVSNNAKGYFSGTENLSDGSQISVANGSFSAGNSGSNGWVLRASSTVTIDFTTYSNVTEIATTSSDSQTFADRTIVATNPATGSSVVATGKCFWFKNASQMSVSHINIVNDAPASPSIASTVRANPSAGFSIASYTGNGTVNSTVGHGLNAVPSFVIIKNRSNAYAWAVLHTSVGTTGTTLDGSAEYYMLQLDSSAARNDFTNDNIWAPTSSTFKINGEGTGNWVNANGDNYVAYSWAPVEGYSAFGSYTGNGSADGPFVYTGFRPKFILLKTTNNTTQWAIFDTERDPYNSSGRFLEPNSSGAEIDFTSSYPNDILSNGFKIKNTGGLTNASGETYVYAAFAEHPFKTARAR